MFDKNELIKNLPQKLCLCAAVLYLSLSLNSGCTFGLLSLSVPDWFALSSSFAFGSLSLSALHKRDFCNCKSLFAVFTLILFVYYFFTFCCSRKNSATLLP